MWRLTLLMAHTASQGQSVRLIWAHTGIGGVPVGAGRCAAGLYPAWWASFVPPRLVCDGGRCAPSGATCCSSAPHPFCDRLRHLGQPALATLRSADAGPTAPGWWPPLPMWPSVAWGNAAALLGVLEVLSGGQPAIPHQGESVGLAQGRAPPGFLPMGPRVVGREIFVLNLFHFYHAAPRWRPAAAHVVGW